MPETERGTRVAGWLAASMRAGHAAKGAIYAAAAALGLWHATNGTEAESGTRATVRAIAEAPFGKVAIAILAAGLASFALSRIALALLDPHDAGWRKRARHLLSAAVHVALVLFVARMVFGVDLAPSEEPTRLVRALARPRGRWFVSGIGAALIALGVRRIRHPREDPASRGEAGALLTGPPWRAAVASGARIARGAMLLTAGIGLLYAAFRAPTSGSPWIAGALALCLLALSANEWARARYPLPDDPG